MTGSSRDLLSVDEALSRILAQLGVVSTEVVPLREAGGRILARQVIADKAIPPFANSAMDGFAFRLAGTPVSATITLRVVGTVPAGATDPGSLSAGEAYRIMTGAPLPVGADTVAPFEIVEQREGIVVIPGDLSRGQSVRPAGLDVTPGTVCIETGVRLRPGHVALCAALGIAQVEVFRLPIVGVLTTGDELTEPGAPLEPGRIYNSNGYGLAAAVSQAGANPCIVNSASDDPQVIRSSLMAFSSCDLVLSSGGVSVGDFDFVKDVLGESGEVSFWRIRMRPGKPLMFGTLTSLDPNRRIPMLGLPGNPTSSMVTFYVFALAAIRKIAGDSAFLPEPVEAVTADYLDNTGGRETFFRVVMGPEKGRLVAHLAGGQDSSMLLPLSRANALARIAANREAVAVGETVPCYAIAP